MISSKLAIVLISMATIAGLATSATARSYNGGGGIGDRQERQARRIANGIEQGQLTRHEIRKLRREQKDIAELTRCLRQVGGRGLQPMERRVIRRLLNAASNNIRDLRHNDERVYSNRRHRTSWHDGYSNTKFNWRRRWAQ